MMRRSLIFITALTALAIATVPTVAQGTRQTAFYAQPAKVRLGSLIRKRFPEFYGKAFPQEELIIEEFYPIGWSRDGKFAYYTEPGDEACGCYFAELSIIDLASDKVLRSFDYNGLDHQGEDEKNQPKSINDMWRQNRKLFSDKLREHNIEPQGRFALLTFPAINGGDQLKANLNVKEINDEEARIYGSISQARLDLVSRRNGKKSIFEKTYDKETEGLPLALKVLGYVKSPFEPRIAVMLTEVYRGYEGPPHTTRIRIVGSNLTGGFK